MRFMDFNKDESGKRKGIVDKKSLSQMDMAIVGMMEEMKISEIPVIIGRFMDSIHQHLKLHDEAIDLIERFDRATMSRCSVELRDVNMDMQNFVGRIAESGLKFREIEKEYGYESH